MIKKASILILLLFAALLLGCTQQGQATQGQNQSQPSQPTYQQTAGQPQVTSAPVEDIAAQALESSVPSSNDNLTNLNDMLVNATS